MAMSERHKQAAEKTANSYTNWLQTAISEMIENVTPEDYKRLPEKELANRVVRSVALVALGRTVTELVSTGMSVREIIEMIKTRSRHSQ